VPLTITTITFFYAISILSVFLLLLNYIDIALKGSYERPAMEKNRNLSRES
jgi:hypothetical protein